MIYYDFSSGSYKPLPYLVEFTVHQTPVKKYSMEQRHWEELVSKWWHHDNLNFSQLTLTSEQQARLDEINAAGEDTVWVRELALYVEWGAVFDNTQCPLLINKEGGEQAKQALLSMTSADLKVRVAKYRYERETEGVTVGGTQVLTDRQTQALIHGAYNSINNGFVNFIDWKGRNGWATLTASEINPIAERAMVHVQICFSSERKVNEDMDALTDLDQLQNTDWESVFDSYYDTLTANHYSS